ncbi:MAG: TRAP transporter substrate-binding protein [Peptococcaceae bacterium]|nr:TRAP transporter substrate-binding protein [Peptococcaceae bacterium]
MKKLIALLLALVMVLSLCACGAKEEAPAEAPAEEAAPAAAEEAAPAEPEFEKMTLKLAHTAAESHIHHIAFTQFAKGVSERTGGAVTVEVYPAGELGDATTLVEQVALGAIDMNLVSQAGLAGYVTKANVLAAPYLFADYDHAHKVIDNFIFDWVAPEASTNMGVEMLAVFDYGFRQVTTKGIPVNTAADLEGVKIRVPPAAGLLAAFDSLGANTQSIAYSELYQSLQQGVVDAQENPVATILADCLYEIQDNLAITNHYFDMQFFVINNNSWNSFSPELQTIIKEEAIKASDLIREDLSSSEAAIIAELEGHGMSVTYPDLSSFTAMMDPAYDAMGELGGADAMAELLAAVEANR